MTKKTTTQKQNNTNEFFKLERNNTRNTNKNKHINQKNQTTLLTNIAQKNTRIAGKTAFFSETESKTRKKNKDKNTKQNKRKTPKTKPT